MCVEAGSLLENDIPEMIAETSHGEQKENSTWIYCVPRKFLITMVMVVAMMCMFVAVAPSTSKFIKKNFMNQQPESVTLSENPKRTSELAQYVKSLIGSATDSPPGTAGVDRRDDIVDVFHLDKSYLDSGYDWTYPSDSDYKYYERGRSEFHPPWGFDRLAIDLHGDTHFLDEEKGWQVVYHGTHPNNLNSILRDGLLIMGGKKTAAHGHLYGNGVYCSPFPDYAKTYADYKVVNGVDTYSMLMCRVRPGSYSIEKKDIWLVGDTDDIKCSALLFSRG